MKILKLIALTLAIWFSSADYSQAQLSEITVDESIGDTLDLAERNKYELFESVEGFQWAVLYVDNDSTVYAKVCYIESNATELRTYGYGPIDKLRSKIHKVNTNRFVKPHLIIRASAGIGIYLMSSMKNTYTEADRLSPSRVNKKPGGGQTYNYSVSWFLNDRLAIGAGLRRMSDGYDTKRHTSMDFDWNWTVTTSFLEVKADVYEIIASYYRAKAENKRGVYYQLGMGYGSLDITSSLRLADASDKAFWASFMLGAESGLFLNYLKIELNIGFQRLKFSDFSITNIEQYQDSADLSDLEQVLVDFYNVGTVDFSGGFIGLSLTIWIH